MSTTRATADDGAVNSTTSYPLDMSLDSTFINDTAVEYTAVSPEASAPKLHFDHAFAKCCKGTAKRLPGIRQNAVNVMRHKLRIVEASNIAAHDLTFRHTDGLEWTLPSFKAKTHATALTKFMDASDSAVAIFKMSDMHPIAIDMALEHWYSGNYEFQIEDNDEGSDTFKRIMKRARPGGYYDVPRNIIQLHIVVYNGAIALGDKNLAHTAFSKVQQAIYQVSDIAVAEAVVDFVFETDISDCDTDFRLRSLVVTWAYTREEQWMKSTPGRYLHLIEQIPEFARMIKEAQYQSRGEYEAEA
ncbi:hypothetical protein SLS60_011159 [Paraconiothyrium brasiliense]|uniref:BTB domain-containing protein n=1 Tax=Paraconiothyrium brasiliense TaxID=300254 RepID=A0ABR3QLA7_9PLEO